MNASEAKTLAGLTVLGTGVALAALSLPAIFGHAEVTVLAAVALGVGVLWSGVILTVISRTTWRPRPPFGVALLALPPGAIVAAVHLAHSRWADFGGLAVVSGVIVLAGGGGTIVFISLSGSLRTVRRVLIRRGNQRTPAP